MMDLVLQDLLRAGWAFRAFPSVWSASRTQACECEWAPLVS